MKGDTDLNQLAKQLHLPTEQLCLKESEESSSGYSVLAKENLYSGTVLGVYKGYVENNVSKLEDGRTVIKVNRSDGSSPVHVMLEDEGHWMKLMRKAALPLDANICLRISGGDIFCTVTSDITREVELKVTCQIPDSFCSYKSRVFKSTASKANDCTNPLIDNSKREASPAPFDSSTKMLDSVSNADDTMALRNSVERNIDDEDVKNASDREEENRCLEAEEISTNGEKEKIPAGIQHCDATETEEDDDILNPPLERIHSTHSPDSNVLRQNPIDDTRVYRCPMCKFFCFQHYAYEKHMRCHHTSNRNAPNKTNPSSFCETCKIQFMSIKTYQVHKEYYCMTRHDAPNTITTDSESPPSVLKTSGDALILNGSAHGSAGLSSMIQPQAIFAAISTNPLILLPVSLVNGQGLVPQSGILTTGVQGLVLKQGASGATVLEKIPDNSKLVNDSISVVSSSQVSRSVSLQKRKISEGDVINLKKACLDDEHHSSSSETVNENNEETEIDQEAPLDLSVKCKKTSVVKRPHVKRRNSSASMGHLSPPNLDGAPSPGPHNIKSSRNVISPNSFSDDASVYCPDGSVVLQRRMSTESVSPQPHVLQIPEKPTSTSIPPISMPPPKLMKQGNNICEECNIVFYKYDNYMAHKKHYCQFRRRQLSALHDQQSSDDANSNHSEPSSKELSGEESKPQPRRVEFNIDYARPSKSQRSIYCCEVCGVKFSTSDNLNAHQTYYCNRNGDNLLQKPGGAPTRKKSTAEMDPPCCPEEWKCNYCDTTCSSYDAIRRHLLTHNELRGFRCIVCGYKGNTLRGMRTHACEHLNGDTSSVEEFVTSSVIVESGGIPIMSRTVDCSDDDSESTKDNHTSMREHSDEASSGCIETKTLKMEHSTTDHSESDDDHHRSPGEHSIRQVGESYSDNDSDSQMRVQCDDSSVSPDRQDNVVNPVSFCDAVIKRETDAPDAEDELSDEEQRRSVIKTEPKPEPEEDYESRSCSPPMAASVIRGLTPECSYQSKKRFRTQMKKNGETDKNNTDMKYCKSCGISFYHLSNFIAHKKYYCVARVMGNFNQETAQVQ